MSRKKLIDIEYCSECPYWTADPPWCEYAGKQIVDGDNIPNWCPLPDAGGEVQS